MMPFSPPGLCGGSASGKTTVATRIIEALDVPWVVLLSMDSFYKVRAGTRAAQSGDSASRSVGLAWQWWDLGALAWH